MKHPALAELTTTGEATMLAISGTCTTRCCCDALLQYYPPNAVEIVGEICGYSLLKNGRIDRSISDHLPIFLRLEVEYGAYDE